VQCSAFACVLFFLCVCPLTEACADGNWSRHVYALTLSTETEDAMRATALVNKRSQTKQRRHPDARVSTLEARCLPCSAGGFSRNLPATTVFFSHAKSASYSAKQYFPLTRNQPASQPASQPNKPKEFIATPERTQPSQLPRTQPVRRA